MAIITGLQYPAIAEHNGVLYVAGYREGRIYLRRTIDGGHTWLRFKEGAEERLICEGAEEAQIGLLKMESQGRRLVAAVPVGEEIHVYVSADDGETWLLDSRL